MDPTIDDEAARLAARKLPVPVPQGVGANLPPTTSAANTARATARAARVAVPPPGPTVYSAPGQPGSVGSNLSRPATGATVSPKYYDTQKTLEDLKFQRGLRNTAGSPVEPIPATNTVNGVGAEVPQGPSGAASRVPGASARPVTPAAGEAAAATAVKKAAPSMLGRASAVAKGVGSRVPLYTTAFQAARTLVDPRSIEASSAGTGGVGDIPAAVGGTVLTAPLGMSAAEGREHWINSNAREKAAVSLTNSDPAARARQEADQPKSWWEYLGEGLQTDPKPRDPARYLDASQREQADAAGVAAGATERARQQKAMGRSDETAYGSGGIASSVDEALNSMMPARQSAVAIPATTREAAPTTVSVPKKAQDEFNAAHPDLMNAAKGLAGTVNRFFGGGEQAPAPNKGGGHDSLGDFTIDNQGQIIRDGKVDTGAGGVGGGLTIVPSSAFHPSAPPIGSGVNQGVDSNVRVGDVDPSARHAQEDYIKQLDSIVGGIGTLNTRGKRELVAQLLGLKGSAIGQRFGSSANRAGEQAKADEAGVSAGINREAVEQGKKAGITYQVGDDGNLYALHGTDLTPVTGADGKPFHASSVKSDDAEAKIAAELFKSMAANALPGADMNAMAEQAREGARALRGNGGGTPPSRADFIKQARKANPKATDDELGAFYDKKYGKPSS